MQITPEDLERKILVLEEQITEEARLEDLLNKYGSDAVIRLTTGFYDDYPEIIVVFKRSETDEEMEFRIRALKERIAHIKRQDQLSRKNKEKDERKIYERLKKKFEPGV
jgi:hypothetical protein